jgi:DNA-directed RNA polymerase specialized sigma24 family protein
MSLSKNTDNILFGKNPRLKDEFNRLFNAIFTNPEECKKIIRLLALKHNGYTREEIAQKSGLPYG